MNIQNLNHLRAMLMLVVCSCTLLGLQAQTQGQYIRKGDEKFEAGDYGSALVYYDTVYQMRNNELDLGYKIAEAARLYKAFLAAVPAYNHVVHHKKGLDKYPLATYWLADVYRSLGEYDSAVHYYEKFQADDAPSVDEYYRERANENLQNCLWAQQQLTGDYQRLDIVHVDGELVNTARKELAPYWDGDKLYFSSLRFVDQEEDPRAKPYAQILLFRDSISDFADSFNVKRRFVSHTAFNAARDRAYFTICTYKEDRYEIKCQIYYRQKNENGRWGSPTRMNNEVNIPEFTSTQPSIGYDNQSGHEVLYFSSDRTGGAGKLDIWSVALDETGDASGSAVNLSDINTREDEITPYFDNYFNLLYFSSEGYNNMGGFDVFETKWENGKWTSPTNKGPAINTSYDETHFSVDATGNLAHFASNHLDKVVHDTSGRIEWRSCCSDLFSVELDKFMRFRPAAYCDTQLDSVVWSIRSHKRPDWQPQLIVDKQQPDQSYYLLELEDKYTFRGERTGYFADSFTVSTVGAVGGSYDSMRLRLFPMVTLTAIFINKLNKKPVIGATVQLSDAQGNTYVGDKNVNEYIYLIRPGNTYTMSISGEDVARRKVVIEVPPSCDPIEIIREVPVLPAKLQLPLFLYFDNDRPDPNTFATSTKVTYEESYLRYYSRKDEFVERMIAPYADGSQPAVRDSVQADVNIFFDDKLKGGYIKLSDFAEELIKYLEAMEEDQRITISIRGFASPLASGEYNKNLTSRRVASVRNYFNAYYGNTLDKFINNRQLVIQEVAFGESKTSKDVGDSRSDERASIYSVKASKERRVEIIDIAAE